MLAHRLRPAPSRRQRWAWTLLAAAALPACGGPLDMAKAVDDGRAATTIPYAGVSEGNRQFPDYTGIRAAILAPEAASTDAKAAPKGGGR